MLEIKCYMKIFFLNENKVSPEITISARGVISTIYLHRNCDVI